MQQPTGKRRARKRGLKRCCYDQCTNDSSKNSEQIYFVSFPKPCYGYRHRFLTTKAQHVSQCWNCAKCELWVKRCGRVDFQSIDDVNKDTYICSLHFVGEKGPTYYYPDPVDGRKNIFNQGQLVSETNLTQKNIESHPPTAESKDCKEDVQNQCIEIKQEPMSPPPEQEDGMNLSTPILLNEIKRENTSTAVSDNNPNVTASIYIIYPDNLPMIISTSNDGDTNTTTCVSMDGNMNTSKEGNMNTSKEGITNTSNDVSMNTGKEQIINTSNDVNMNTSKEANTITTKEGNNSLRESIIVKNPMIAHVNELKKERPLRSQSVQTECKKATKMNKRIQVKLRRLSLLNIFENSIKANEKQCRFYTSLSYPQIIILHNLVNPEEVVMEMDQHINETNKEMQKSTSLQQLILTLIRLRIRIMIEDLAYRFEIPSTTLSEIVKRWIDILYNKFKSLKPLEFLFPSAVVFQEAPGRSTTFASINKIKVIIDCIEFQCQLPSTVEEQDSCCYCEPKLVYKALIGCTSRGGVCFVSDMYEGNMTCSEIFIKSKLADYLEPGDIVLADIKFAIRDIVESKHAFLNVPPNLNGKNNLSYYEEMELKLVNMHHQYIKHVIARINNFKFLQTAFPPHLRPLMSKVLYVCACLVNFQPPVVID